MPDEKAIVINTGPIIALVAALGRLDVPKHLYARVLVPFEVGEELLAGDMDDVGAPEFRAATWLEKRTIATSLAPHLRSVLHPGEASEC
jgi:predicted nucleic acid-binding protein